MDALLPPPIDGDPVSLFLEAGADVDERGVPHSFGNEAACVDALNGAGFVVVSRSHGRRLRVAGADRAELVSRLVGVELPPSGEGVAQDGNLVLSLASSALLLLPPTGSLFEQQAAAPWPTAAGGDDASVADVAGATAVFAIAGPGVVDALQHMQAPELADAAAGAHRLLNFRGSPLLIASTAPLGAHPCAVLVADESAAGELWSHLVGPLGGLPAGEALWQVLITQAV